jgi:streptogramin lyase
MAKSIRAKGQTMIYKTYTYDLFGNVQWEFAHDKMKGPNGITCGENGELYVLCFKSNNLFMLDTEGKHGEDIFLSTIPSKLTM